MQKKRKTKVIATLGPASASEEVISRLITAGVDLFRLNFSHGIQEEHRKIIKKIRCISTEKRKPIAIIQDLQGPKVRIGHLKKTAYNLKRNKPFTLLKNQCIGTDEAASTDYPILHKKVRAGDQIMVNDGQIVLQVLHIKKGDIFCRIVEEGLLQAHKGVNVPKRELGFPVLTEKDKSDLTFGLNAGVDYIALSMVRNAKDILSTKQFIQKTNKSVPVIAKLEQAMAITHLDEILKVADGVMVARGDLGVEIPLEQVPTLQKKIIRKANDAQIPVITATQMLESMMFQTRPTRAEVSDVANAIFDGTDAVMLSGETAAGHYPIKTVRMMTRIINQAESLPGNTDYFSSQHRTLPQAVSQAACQLASQMNAKAIVTSTLSGGSALRLSKYRPGMPIIAFTPDPMIKRRMSLYWGVEPHGMSMLSSGEDIFDEMIKGIDQAKLASKKSLLIMISQSPSKQPESSDNPPTDLIKVHQVST